MKKLFLFFALAAGMFAASCTKTVVTVVSPAGEGSLDQKLVIAVSSGKDLMTKAGRPLLSEAPGQDIEEITLYFVDASENVALVKTVTSGEWANAVDHSTNGKQLEVTLKASNGETLTADAQYTIYALGYSKTGSVYTLPTLTKNGAFDEDAFYATVASSPFDAEEIFAGSVTVWAETVTTESGATVNYLTTTENGKPTAVPTVILNRQVAGVTGYFTNIPAKVNDKVPAYVRLVASNKYTHLHFINLYNKEIDAPSATTDAYSYVVNGSTASAETKVKYFDSSKEGYTLYEIALKDWFQFGEAGDTYTTFDAMDLNGDGYVGYLDAICHVYKTDDKTEAEGTWSDDIKDDVNHNPLNTFWTNAGNSKQQLVAGSVFAGKFVIPFHLVENTNTLELQVLDSEKNVLKNWNVSIPEDEMSAGASTGAATGVETVKDDVSVKIYNIYRNHMYSLGSKLKTSGDNDGETPDPDDPDPDPKPEPDPDPDGPDQPQELNSNDLLIHVNDQWEIIHDMVID